jgi:putative flippase GtrA
MNSALLKKIFSFGIVGGVGFAVDAGVLTVLSSKMGVNIYLARLCSFTVAVFVTWMLNRKWVFKSDGPRTTTKTNEYLSYLTVQIVGALINLGIFSLTIFYFPGLKAYPVIPLAFGSACGMFFNFIGAHVWVFKPRQS